MTTYVAILTTDIDQDSPITQPLLTAIRDNPIAIAEGDSSTPSTLRAAVLLGTLTMSGSVQTLSGLTLTNYSMLRIIAYFTGGAGTLVTGGVKVGVTTASSLAISGIIMIDLASGVAVGTTSVTGGASPGTVLSDQSSLRNSSTSISFSGHTFVSGTIAVWGVK